MVFHPIESRPFCTDFTVTFAEADSARLLLLLFEFTDALLVFQDTDAVVEYPALLTELLERVTHPKICDARYLAVLHGYREHCVSEQACFP